MKGNVSMEMVVWILALIGVVLFLTLLFIPGKERLLGVFGLLG